MAPGEPFPGVDSDGIRNPPRANDPREKTLQDGTEVKWCGLCGKWGDHYRAGHPEDSAAVAEVEANVAMDDDVPPTGGAFARLRASGLI